MKICGVFVMLVIEIGFSFVCSDGISVYGVLVLSKDLNFYGMMC